MWNFDKMNTIVCCSDLKCFSCIWSFKRKVLPTGKYNWMFGFPVLVLSGEATFRRFSLLSEAWHWGATLRVYSLLYFLFTLSISCVWMKNVISYMGTYYCRSFLTYIHIWKEFKQMYCTMGEHMFQN